MYEAFYGLARRPFSTVPDAEGIYWSDGHAQAFAVLRYGLMSRAPITLLTGEIGAGKTTLIRRLLVEMPEELTVGLLSGVPPGRGALMDWILLALGEPAERRPLESHARFQDLVVRRYGEGQRVLIIVDEAQTLGADALEELRLLTNLNSDGDELLQLVLAGQPQLRELLADPALRQLAQRISADAHLGPLGAGETADYIAARLEAAGARRPLLSRAASALVHEATGGAPRLINILCELALVCGYAAGRETVGEDLLREVLDAARTQGIYSALSADPRPLMLVPGGGHGVAAPRPARGRG